jgi:hypothetical protein
MAEEKKPVAAKAPKAEKAVKAAAPKAEKAPKKLLRRPPRRKPKRRKPPKGRSPEGRSQSRCSESRKKAEKAVSEDKVREPSDQEVPEQVVPALIKKFGYTSVMQCPKLEKIVINIGVGDATQNAKALEDSVAELATITGQHPVTTKAKKVHRDLQGPPGTGHWLQSHASWTPDV